MKNKRIITRILLVAMLFFVFGRLSGQVALTPKEVSRPGKTDGQIQADLIGTPPFKLQLSVRGQTESLQTKTNLQTKSFLFKNLPAGTYIVKAYHRKDVYLGESEVTVGEIEALKVESGPVVTSAGCFGPGKITLTVSGGAGDYTITLTGGKSPIVKTSGTGKATFDKLAAGTYVLSITDARKGEPLVIRELIIAPYVPVEGTVTEKKDVTGVGANNGKIVVVGKGGTGPYSYALNGDFSKMNETGQFENLSEGEQIVMVRDSAGCMAPVLFTIQQSAP